MNTSLTLKSIDVSNVSKNKLNPASELFKTINKGEARIEKKRKFKLLDKERVCCDMATD